MDSVIWMTLFLVAKKKKKKDLLSTGHPLTFLFSLLCLLQLLEAQAAQILQALLARCRELVLAGEEKTRALPGVDGAWTFPESHWRSLQMKINTDGSVNLSFLIDSEVISTWQSVLWRWADTFAQKPWSMAWLHSSTPTGDSTGISLGKCLVLPSTWEPRQGGWLCFLEKNTVMPENWAKSLGPGPQG